MSAIAEKIRKARETKVTIGKITFTVRRPTDIEMMDLRGHGSVARLLPYVVGWDGAKESDVINGGDPHPLKFDPDVRDEWLADRSDLLGALVDAIINGYNEHSRRLEEKAKN